MRRLSLFLLVPLASASAAAEARPPIVFDSATLTRHRLEGEQSVSVPAAAGSPSGGVPVTVIVSPEGKVTSARVDEGSKLEKVDPGPALAAARRWKFRPLRYRGVPVAARGTVTISYLTPPRWRDPEAPLPPIDYASLKISLARSACLGS